MEQLTLNQIIDITGVSRRTIQRYEKFGLVSHSNKNKYGHLLYDNSAVERINSINFYHKIGFSVKEIVSIIDAPSEVKKSVLKPKILELERRCDEFSTLLLEAKSFLNQL